MNTEARSNNGIYTKIHTDLTKARGKAKTHICMGYLEFCGENAAEWAHHDRSGESFLLFIENKKDGKVYKSYRWVSYNTDDYIPLCRKHHLQMDRDLRNDLRSLGINLTEIVNDRSSVKSSLKGAAA